MRGHPQTTSKKSDDQRGWPRRPKLISRREAVQHPVIVRVSSHDHVMVIDPVPESPVAFGHMKLVDLARVPQGPTVSITGAFPGINNVSNIVDRGSVRVWLARHINFCVLLAVIE